MRALRIIYNIYMDLRTRTAARSEQDGEIYDTVVPEGVSAGMPFRLALQ